MPSKHVRSAQRWALVAIFASIALSPVAFRPTEVLVTSVTTGSVLRYDEATGAFLGFYVPPADPLVSPHATTRGPDGHWYVTSFAGKDVRRYDGMTGALIDEFIPPGSGGLGRATHSFFGPDGNFFVTAFNIPAVLRFDPTTGAFIDQWIAPGNGLIDGEVGEFGPDGHYYIANGQGSNVLRYDGETGAFIDEFVASGAGGLDNCHALDFRPDGHLLVTSFDSDRIVEFDRTGALVRTFVAGISQPHGIEFRPDGLMYATAFGTNNVLRYDAQTGAFVDEFISSGLGGLSGPNSIDFTRDDTLNLSRSGNQFRVYLADPGELVFLLRDGPTHVPGGINQYGPQPYPNPCGWRQLQLQRPLLVGSAIADGAGIATFTWFAPAMLSGTTVRMQAIGQDTCRPSSLHRFTLP